MRTLAIVVVLASTAHAQAPGDITPLLPDARAEHGYWYQTLIADAAATGVMLVGLERGNTRTIGVGLTMFALGGPIIHALHGHGRRALLSLSVLRHRSRSGWLAGTRLPPRPRRIPAKPGSLASRPGARSP